MSPNHYDRKEVAAAIDWHKALSNFKQQVYTECRKPNAKAKRRAQKRGRKANR